MVAGRADGGDGRGAGWPGQWGRAVGLGRGGGNGDDAELRWLAAAGGRGRREVEEGSTTRG